MVESCFFAAISAGLAVGTGVSFGVDVGVAVGAVTGVEVGAPVQPASAESKRTIAAARKGRRLARECRNILPAYDSRPGVSRERSR
jgi:hypothetical protein